MKTVTIIIAFFSLSVGFCQNGELTGRVTDDYEMAYPGLLVKLIKDGSVLDQTQTDFYGNYQFKNLPFGTYAIILSYVSLREDTYENIILDKELNTIHLTYPKPCVSTKKVCPKGHTKNIIPIVYGLPSSKMMKEAENKKIKLGGCNPYCEKWHCTEHNLDF